LLLSGFSLIKMVPRNKNIFLSKIQILDLMTSGSTTTLRAKDSFCSEKHKNYRWRQLTKLSQGNILFLTLSLSTFSLGHGTKKAISLFKISSIGILDLIISGWVVNHNFNTKIYMLVKKRHFSFFFTFVVKWFQFN